MGGFQAERRLLRRVLVSALCGFASLALSAQPSSAPGATDAPEVTQAAAAAASAVAAAKAAAKDAAETAKAASAVAADPASAAQATARCPGVGAPYCEAIPVGWILIVVGLYAAAFATVRWYFVARPNLHNLEGQVEALRQWVAANPRRASATGDLDDEQTERLLTRIDALARPCQYSFLDKLLWSRGKDLIGWTLFYSARELLVARQSPESLRCFLEGAAQELAGADPASAALAQRITAELAVVPLDPHDAGRAVMQELHAYLARFDDDLDGEVARMIAARAGTMPPTPAAALALIKRVGLALAPPASLAKALAALHSLVPLWQQLVEHARDVALPDATAGQRVLDALATAQPAPTVDACVTALEQCSGQRRALRDFATRLRGALEAAPLASSERRIALAREVLESVHHKNLVDYDTRFTWHRKSLWLGWTALLLVLLLAVAVGNPVLFLMGAFGGLLSRLRVAVTAGGLGQGQDLHWTSLLLSPLLGALAAWGGMLLISLGVKLGVLGTAFNELVWGAALSPTLLGIALLLGFAERLFLDVAGRLQSKFDPPATASSQAKPGGG